LFFYLKLYLYF